MMNSRAGVLVRIVLVLFGMMLPGAASGQVVTPGNAPDAMKQLEFLAGTWRGTGTITQGPNQQSDADVVETVQFKLQGSVLMMEGRGTIQVDGTERVVHDALALLSHDPSNGRFVMRTYRAGGEMLEPDVEVTRNKIVWGFDEPRRGGRIRFTLTVDDGGNWRETGEFSPNGETWYPFFKMNLQKVNDPK